MKQCTVPAWDRSGSLGVGYSITQAASLPGNAAPHFCTGEILFILQGPAQMFPSGSWPQVVLTSPLDSQSFPPREEVTLHDEPELAV